MTDTPKRIQLSRKKGWRKPAGAIVVARPSKWGNPFRVGGDVTPALAVALYRQRLKDLLGERGRYGMHSPSGEQLLHDLATELRGHDLGCWCQLDQPCHADVLLEVANA